MRILAAMLAFISCFGMASANEPAGIVDASVPQSWAQREGQKSELVVGDGIFVSDVIATGKDGRLDVKFEDGTTMALGPNSEIIVNDFVMTDSKNSFSAGIMKGAARLVTGDLVKRNPNGFKVTTPRATIGIRGTTVAFGVDTKGNEFISVTEIGDSSHVTIISDSGRKHKIEEAGYSYVAPFGEEGGVLQNNDTITRLIENFVSAIETGTTTETEMDGILNSLVEEADSHLDNRPNSEGTAGESAGNTAESLINPNQRKEGGNAVVNSNPAPRDTGCE